LRLTNWNGPTHTGSFENFSPSLASCLGDMIMPERSASCAASGAYGLSRVSRTVSELTTFTDFTGSSSLDRAEALRLRWRSSDVLTAWASIVVPSLNLTPLRMVIVTVLPPLVIFGIEAASCGTICSLSLTS